MSERPDAIVDALVGERELSDTDRVALSRCIRPFLLEALQLAEERVAGPVQIDHICRVGGNFPVGPFELIERVGPRQVLESLAIAFGESFGEPRWQPSRLLTRMAERGDGDGKTVDSPQPPKFGGGTEQLIVIAGDGVLPAQLRTAALDADYNVALPSEAVGKLPHLILDCGAAEDDPPLEGGPQAVLCADGSLAALDLGGTAVGFNLLPPIDRGHTVELTRGPYTTDAACERATEFFATLGRSSEWVGDAAGLVLGRIVAQLINEAAFTLQEEDLEAEQIDRSIESLGLPYGPLKWCDEIGSDHVIAILEALAAEYRPDRYRVAPLLRHNSWVGKLGRHTGEGFYDYEDMW